MPKAPEISAEPLRDRTNIDKGKSADKKPGFDPSAAPMETDAEASGAATDADMAAMNTARQGPPDHSDWQGGHGTAMRPFADDPEKGRTVARRAILLAVLGVIGLFLLIALIMGGFSNAP